MGGGGPAKSQPGPAMGVARCDARGHFDWPAPGPHSPFQRRAAPRHAGPHQPIDARASALQPRSPIVPSFPYPWSFFRHFFVSIPNIHKRL